MELSEAVYQATKLFPKEELFGLTNQLRRASVSVPSNLAEGRGRLTPHEFLHFLGIARGSALEVETQLELARRLQYGNEGAVQQAQELAVEVGRILNASISTLRAECEALKQKRRERPLAAHD